MAEHIITLSEIIVNKKTAKNLDDGTIDEKTFLIEAVQNGSITIQEICEESENDKHLGCFAYPNCDIDPMGCTHVTRGKGEEYGHRD